MDNNNDADIVAYNNPNEFDGRVSLLLIGDSGVGKSTLLDGFIGVKLPDGFSVGCNLKFEDSTDTRKLRVTYRDTSEIAKYDMPIMKNFIAEADGIMLIYDVTNETSFQNIRNWMSLVQDHASSFVRILIVGNKNDLQEQRVVSKEQGEQLTEFFQSSTDYFQLSFNETTAIDCNNVEICSLLACNMYDGMLYHHRYLVTNEEVEGTSATPKSIS